VTAKYAALTRLLETAPADQAVTMTRSELDRLVGGLPPSSNGPTWWGNTWGNSQAQAWMSTGRRVRRSGQVIRFSAVGAVTQPVVNRQTEAPRPRAGAILDGIAALDGVLRAAGYGSVAAAVARHSIFLHPETVAQTRREALFRVIRNPTRRRSEEMLADGPVLLDDNTTPTLCFLWAAAKTSGLDVQYNHVWTDAKNPALYTALWNIFVTPAFLAKTTDGRNHPEVRKALQYHAYQLYGASSDGRPTPKPETYSGLEWAPMPDPVPNLEQVLRARLAARPKSPPAIAARRFGWLFSGWQPDPTV